MGAFYGADQTRDDHVAKDSRGGGATVGLPALFAGLVKGFRATRGRG